VTETENGARSGAESCVEIQGIERSFGSRQVLVQLSLTVHPGEFVAIVGRSGSGKSTLLRLLSGLDRADEGRIVIDGQALDGLCRSARIVFQDGRLLPWLRVIDNVALGLPPGSQGMALQMLERVGLAGRQADWPAVLSGGQRQRVALARALASRPRLLLFDEPLGSLDALTRLEMQQLIAELWQSQQFTAVLITHDVEEAVYLADRVLLLDHGHLTDEWSISLERPRRHDDPRFVQSVQQILERVMQHQP
jgi:sulfonate transport system ATP-binding protein